MFELLVHFKIRYKVLFVFDFGIRRTITNDIVVMLLCERKSRTNLTYSDIEWVMLFLLSIFSATIVQLFGLNL